jgi:hypothetical protein
MRGRVMAVSEAYDQETDYLDLPSGGRVDLFNLNADAIRTQEDAHWLMQILQERILDIEYQLECYMLGCWPNGRPITPIDKPDILWQVRAKKALGWAKLHKSTAQQRLQYIASSENKKEQQARQSRKERLFVDCAKGILDRETFERIMTLANSLEDRGLTAP